MKRGMEWNYLWVKQEQYRERVRRLEMPVDAVEGEASPPLPDSIRFTLTGFLIGVGIAAGMALLRGREAPAPLVLPPANPLTQEKSFDSQEESGDGNRFKKAESPGGKRLPASQPAARGRPRPGREAAEP